MSSELVELHSLERNMIHSIRIKYFLVLAIIAMSFLVAKKAKLIDLKAKSKSKRVTVKVAGF